MAPGLEKFLCLALITIIITVHNFQLQLQLFDLMQLQYSITISITITMGQLNGRVSFFSALVSYGLLIVESFYFDT